MACSKCGGSKYKDYDLFCDHVVTPPKAPRSFNLDRLKDAISGYRTHRPIMARPQIPLTVDYCMLELRVLASLGLVRHTVHDEIEILVGVDLARDKTAEDPSVTGTFCYPADGLKTWLPPSKEPQRVLRLPHKDHKKDPAE